MRLLSLSPVTAPVAAVDVEAQDTFSPTIELPPTSFAEQAITQAAYERLQSPTGNAAGLSTVGFSDDCLRASEGFLDFLAQTVDENPDMVFGFAQDCVPDVIIENTNERTVNPVSPAQLST